MAASGRGKKKEDSNSMIKWMRKKKRKATIGTIVLMNLLLQWKNLSFFNY